MLAVVVDVRAARQAGEFDVQDRAHDAHLPFGPRVGECGEQCAIEALVHHADESGARPAERRQDRMRVDRLAALREVFDIHGARHTMDRGMRPSPGCMRTRAAGEHHVRLLQQRLFAPLEHPGLRRMRSRFIDAVVDHGARGQHAQQRLRHRGIKPGAVVADRRGLDGRAQQLQEQVDLVVVKPFRANRRVGPQHPHVRARVRGFDKGRARIEHRFLDEHHIAVPGEAGQQMLWALESAVPAQV